MFFVVVVVVAPWGGDHPPLFLIHPKAPSELAAAP